MKIFKPGTTVKMGSVVASVSAVVIRAGGYVQYQVISWDGTYRHQDWVDAFEVQSAADSEWYELEPPNASKFCIVKKTPKESGSVTLKEEFPTGNISNYEREG